MDRKNNAHLTAKAKVSRGGVRYQIGEQLSTASQDTVSEIYVPEEILNEIVQYLDPRPPQGEAHDNDKHGTIRQNLQTLARLSRVSKQLHRLVEPMLYGSFPGHQIANAGLWLNSILTRPGRARQVRHLTLHKIEWWGPRRRRRYDSGRVCSSDEDTEDDDGSEPEPDLETDVNGSEDDDDPSTIQQRRLTMRQKPKRINSTDTPGDSQGIAVETEGTTEQNKLTSTSRTLQISREFDSGCLQGMSVSSLKRVIDLAEFGDDWTFLRAKLHRKVEELRKSGVTSSVDLMMSLMVLACTSLESLAIDFHERSHHALFVEVLNAHRAGTISHVSLCGRRGEQIEPGGAESLFKMLERRNVESLDLTYDNLVDLGFAGPPHGARDLTGDSVLNSDLQSHESDLVTWRSMKRICLKDCSMPDESYPCPVTWLLQVCPALSSLELISENCSWLLLLDLYGDSIRRHSLQLLRLVIDAGSSWNGPKSELRLRLRQGLFGVGSLQELTNLKELIITPWALLSPPESPTSVDDPSPPDEPRHLVNHLPHTLESLTLLPCHIPQLIIDVDQEINLLRLDSAFADLKIDVLESDVDLESGEASESESETSDSTSDGEFGGLGPGFSSDEDESEEHSDEEQTGADDFDTDISDAEVNYLQENVGTATAIDYY